MKRIAFSALGVMLIVIAGFSCPSAFEIDSDVLGGFQLHAPDSAAEKKYLGISATGTFTLPHIGADVIIV
jgi:hypothetical protein